MLQMYEFEDNEVRTKIGEDGKPWFVGTDVCRCLGLVNVTRSLDRLQEDEKGFHSVNTPGGKQRMLTVNESGLYRLIMTSRKPEAEKFRHWVFHEVLPSIRRTGSYSMGSEALVESDDVPLAVLQQQTQLISNLISKVIQAKQERAVFVTELSEVRELAERPAAIALKDVPPMTKRKAFNRMVRSHAYERGGDFGTAYNRVYRSFRDRFSIDLKRRADNRKISVVEYAKRDGYLDDLLSLTVELYGIGEDELRKIFEGDLPAELTDTTSEVKRLAESKDEKTSDDPLVGE